jgi:plasmid stabilization system protein ParE
VRLRISRRADADLEAIWNYIAQDSADAADRVEERLHSAMCMLAEFPGLGHRRSGVTNPAYRFWNVFNYIIAFRVRGRSLTVVRVLHGSRDFRKLFRRRR